MHALVVGGTGMLREATLTLAQALRRAVGHYGPIQLAVCWIHSSAPEALQTVAAELGRSGEPCRLFHVRGSAAADPTRLPRPALDELPPTVSYRQVILGFQIEGNRSRWLTHREISQGVLQAIEDDAEYRAVGVVRPWEMRP